MPGLRPTLLLRYCLRCVANALRTWMDGQIVGVAVPKLSRREVRYNRRVLILTSL